MPLPPYSAYPAATLAALLDRIIPPDEFPGAVEAGVERYIVQQLAGDCAAEAPWLAQGLRLLDVEASTRHGPDVTFNALDQEKQDLILREIESGRVALTWPKEISPPAFFARIAELAHEGYYADPANGGNREASSWRMIGYDPLVPPRER